MNTENENVEVENQQKNDGDKISKEFDKNFNKMVALLGGPQNLKKLSLPGDKVGEVVQALLKERLEGYIKDFKEKAIILLDKKIQFDKEVKAAEEQLKKTVNEKKKGFTEEMKKLFAMVGNMEEVVKSYNENLKGIAPTSTTENTTVTPAPKE